MLSVRWSFRDYSTHYLSRRGGGEEGRRGWGIDIVSGERKWDQLSLIKYKGGTTENWPSMKGGGERESHIIRILKSLSKELVSWQNLNSPIFMPIFPSRKCQDKKRTKFLRRWHSNKELTFHSNHWIFYKSFYILEYPVGYAPTMPRVVCLVSGRMLIVFLSCSWCLHWYSF